MSKLGFQILHGLWLVILGLAWIWCCLAALFSPLSDRWWGQLIVATFFIASALAIALLQKRPRRRDAAILIVMAIVAMGYFTRTPQASADPSVVWDPNHQKPLTARFVKGNENLGEGSESALASILPAEGTRVELHNVRSSFGEQVQFNRVDVTLESLETVWLGVQQFAAQRGIAHTFTSFGFSTGEYWAISVESRRKKGQRYSPLAGLFRHYELIYVMGDEEDVIGKRALADDHHPIYLYRIEATPQQAQSMFVAMLNRANHLAEHPEFYNTISNNCTSNIVERFNEIAPHYISPYDPRIMLPGYSGGVAYEQGLLGDDQSFEWIQERAQINDRAKAAMGTGLFSQQIRMPP